MKGALYGRNNGSIGVSTSNRPAPNTAIAKVSSTKRWAALICLIAPESLVYSPPGVCRSRTLKPPKSINATNTNGSNCVTGTSPIDDVTFGFGVKPECAMVIPVVALAMGLINDAAKMKIMAIPRRSPIKLFLMLVPGKLISMVLLSSHDWKRCTVCFVGCTMLLRRAFQSKKAIRPVD